MIYLVQKVVYCDPIESLIGSEMTINSEEINDGINSFVTKKNEIQFYKSFSLIATLYKDKNDIFLVSFPLPLSFLYLFIFFDLPLLL